MKYQGTNIEIDFFDFDHILFYFIIACLVWGLFYVIYWGNFRRWSCKDCGKNMIGDTQDCNQGAGKCAECCGWKTISVAEYQRSFGIKPKLTVVK